MIGGNRVEASGELRKADRIVRNIAMALLFCLGFPRAAPAQQPSPPLLPDLSEKSLEDLMNMQVTSVSKKEQKLSQVAAAIFVITQEDIHRSGATNIPDLLRMVPGLDVAQINGNTWAISARGFNLQFANKLLVLIDGRAVYSPLFGGVNWDTQDVPLEDIERIEVIRGPGGTIWGANAVNGVINIITKRAGDTHGALVSGGGGTTGQSLGTAQYGGNFAGNASYRIFTKYLNVDHLPDLQGQDASDGYHLLHGGFRADASLSANDPLTVQGDLYAGREGAAIVHSSFDPPENEIKNSQSNLSGGNILGRWSHIFSSASETTLQFFFDQYARGGPESRESRNTFDIDFQHHFAWGARNDLIWGAGYRHTSDRTVGTIDQAFIPANVAGELFTFFVQDQIAVKPDRVFLTIGTKVENSYFTGFDIEPSMRVAWTPSSRRTFWAAISRATRTPTRRDTDLSAVLAALPGPAEVLLTGNPNQKSEHVESFEVGYRAQPSERVSLDATIFYNLYDGLESVEPLPDDVQQNPPLLIHPLTFANKLSGTTEGIELSVNWKVTDRWTLSPGYTFLQMHLRTDSTSEDLGTPDDTEGTSPHHQAQLRSHVGLFRGLAWDLSAWYVDRLPAPQIAAYTRLDSQLSWHLAERVELRLVGQNLLRDHHVEFNDSLQSVNSSQVKRTAHAELSWRF